MVIFSKTIIPLGLVGYEMIIANSELRASLAIISYPTRPRGIIVKYDTLYFSLAEVKVRQPLFTEQFLRGFIELNKKYNDCQ